jgi:thiaminase/transcriptional activator TenA
MASVATGRQTLSGDLWSSIEDVYAAILAHPFVTGLTDGSLDRDAFRFYVIQDSLYLRDYAKALAVTGARAPAPADTEVFTRSALTAIAAERDLHEALLGELGIEAAEVATSAASPTNLAYTSYILRVVQGGSYADAVAAVLPCGWIYWEVGKELVTRGSTDPVYRRWIETYGGEEYAEGMREWLALTDRLGETLSEADRERAREIFVQASRYEWMFWDMGYRKEAWPV